jgi:hypothetical protein
MAPSCCNMPIMSQLAQLSTILLSQMRSMVIPVQVSSRFVGSTPMKAPLWVPIDVKRVVTMSASTSRKVDCVVEVGEGLAELLGEGLHGLDSVQVAGILGVVVLMIDVIWGVERIGGI